MKLRQLHYDMHKRPVFGIESPISEDDECLIVSQGYETGGRVEEVNGRFRWITPPPSGAWIGVRTPVRSVPAGTRILLLVHEKGAPPHVYDGRLADVVDD